MSKNNINLKLVKPTEEYKEQVMNYRKTFLENEEELSGCALLENCKSFDEWIDFTNRLSKEYGDGYVPSTVYLAIRIEDNKLVGIIDFRHKLSDFLFNYGGNIGYSVLPEERRKGYAKEMLSLMLEICKKKGLKRVLITCDKNNIASAKTINANGGILENEIADKNIISKSGILQRYWINLKVNIQIRKIEKDDEKQIIPLLEQVSKLHIERRPDIFKAKKIEDIEKDALKIIEDKEKITLVAKKDKEILGIIVLKIKEVSNHTNLKNSRALYIDELCVDEENRGEGIGKMLINRAKEMAKELKCERLELNCWEANNEAIVFYEKQGMENQRRIMEIKI